MRTDRHAEANSRLLQFCESGHINKVICISLYNCVNTERNASPFWDIYVVMYIQVGEIILNQEPIRKAVRRNWQCVCVARLTPESKSTTFLHIRKSGFLLHESEGTYIKQRLDYLLFALAEQRRYLQSVRLVTAGLP